jgi:uncharacterized protein
MKAILYILLGFGFSTILIYSEAFHWLRIQEMFQFQSFHMFGLLFSAIGTAALSLLVLKRLKLRTITSEEIVIKKKPIQLYANGIGGLLFGAGWAITGACSAPLFILAGFNWKVALPAIAGALFGALLYGILKPKLPHE